MEKFVGILIYVSLLVVVNGNLPPDYEYEYMYDWPPHTISPAPIAWTNVGESLTLIYNSSYYSEWVTFAHHSASGVKYYEIGIDYYDEYLAACVEETFPVLYQVFCVDLTNHMIFTIPNITEDNHNDVWSVKSTEEPEAVNTTVFIRGNVVSTNVSVDDDNRLLVKTFTDKKYPEVDESFIDVQVSLIDEPMNTTEMILVEGTVLLPNNTLAKNSTLAKNGTLANNKTLANDAAAEVQNLITWRSISQMTDGRYMYNVSYTDIVFAGLMEGEFCVGSACLAPSSSGVLACNTWIYTLLATVVTLSCRIGSYGQDWFLKIPT